MLGRTLRTLPLFVLLMGVGAVAMLLPALHAWASRDFASMRAFSYAALLFALLTGLIALATTGRQPRSAARSQLLTLLLAYALLPLMFAVPFQEAGRNITFFDAWFEMVSSFTTTGAALFEDAGRLQPSLHLWRATVGWLGGLLAWIMAIAIFAPMNLGGFEVRTAGGGPRASASHFNQIGRTTLVQDRLFRHAGTLVPIYAALTFVLWLGLVIAGEVPYIALCHAMAVLSSSGISPIGGLYFATSGVWGEMLIFAFFVFALSRLTFSRGMFGDSDARLRRDPEMRLAFGLIAGTTILLFARHFIITVEEGAPNGLTDLFASVWGSLFTVTSFLTTTGFESRYWEGATVWSGLETPGLFLVGLALIGGGVATTAGGVKLLRVYALARHSEREVERLLHPSSVGGGGREARMIRQQGAYVAWIFFMLFALSVAATMLLLSLTGVQFETAMVLTVASLSNTGPLAIVAAEQPIAYAGLPYLAQTVLAGAMVLGRLETLAIVALFNPEIWRR
ncbi:trk system potassium uptake protein TrkH [Loktanella fryxellensis]|uniref:Trk system potassium uptake protein TrkH n=1 Tax=Loktanella fryxellensis TaxID=245187 RepID=A0A1H8I285_9RHOB|nr:potassium transporter TrkG [Loktanella fryxellensis]SEN62452.1 trk system potassium uptake protein TrkH [Loktanella fryxellensis]